MLDSVIYQTLEDIEILCINDDSTDNSQAILNEYAKKDKRFKLFYRKHEPNESWGYTNAINIGRKNATGEYVIFPDSDDYLELNALELLYNASSQGKADVVKGRHALVEENEKLINIFQQLNINHPIFNWENLDEENKVLHLLPMVPQFQSFLIKRTFQENIPFCIYCGMDTTTAFKIKLLAKDFRYIDNIVYTSIAHNKNYDKYIFDLIKICDELEKFIKDYKINPDIWKYFNHLKINTLILCVSESNMSGKDALKYYDILYRDFSNIDLPKTITNGYIIKNFNRIKYRP